MIKALSADTADQAFNVRILPWRSWRRDDFFDAHVLDTLAEVHSVDAVAVSDQETGVSSCGKASTICWAVQRAVG